MLMRQSNGRHLSRFNLRLESLTGKKMNDVGTRLTRARPFLDPAKDRRTKREQRPVRIDDAFVWYIPCMLSRYSDTTIISYTNDFPLSIFRYDTTISNDLARCLSHLSCTVYLHMTASFTSDSDQTEISIRCGRSDTRVSWAEFVFNSDGTCIKPEPSGNQVIRGRTKSSPSLTVQIQPKRSVSSKSIP